MKWDWLVQQLYTDSVQVKYLARSSNLRNVLTITHVTSVIWLFGLDAEQSLFSSCHSINTGSFNTPRALLIHWCSGEGLNMTDMSNGWELFSSLYKDFLFPLCLKMSAEKLLLFPNDFSLLFHLLIQFLTFSSFFFISLDLLMDQLLFQEQEKFCPTNPEQTALKNVKVTLNKNCIMIN